MVEAVSVAPSLPAEGYVRLRQIVGDPKANPPIPAVLPIGKSTWWKGVAEGKYPAPVKLSQRVTCWRVQDIRDILTMGENDR